MGCWRRLGSRGKDTNPYRLAIILAKGIAREVRLKPTKRRRDIIQGGIVISKVQTWSIMSSSGGKLHEFHRVEEMPIEETVRPPFSAPGVG
jgi:hypothetical protein